MRNVKQNKPEGYFYFKSFSPFILLSVYKT